MNKIESLKLIIQEARQVSPEFDFKYSYWVEKRMKNPKSDWLLKLLINALGEERIQKHLDNIKK